MKIYVLKAHGERGKTTTLKLLLCKLVDKYGVNSIINVQNKQLYIGTVKKEINQDKIDRRNKINNPINNISVALNINGKIVCIYSAGDNEYELKKATDFFFMMKCDVAFGAVRSKGKTIDELEKFKNKVNASVEYINKAVVLNANGFKNFDDYIDNLNDYQADELLKKV